mgnify:FL=1
MLASFVFEDRFDPPHPQIERFMRSLIAGELFSRSKQSVLRPKPRDHAANDSDRIIATLYDRYSGPGMRWSHTVGH